SYSREWRHRPHGPVSLASLPSECSLGSGSRVCLLDQVGTATISLRHRSIGVASELTHAPKSLRPWLRGRRTKWLTQLKSGAVTFFGRCGRAPTGVHLVQYGFADCGGTQVRESAFAMNLKRTNLHQTLCEPAEVSFIHSDL